MEAVRGSDRHITLRMSEAEAVVLHEVIAFSDFAHDLEVIELDRPVEQKVLSEVQRALNPLIPGLGQDTYVAELDRAYSAIDPTPY
ncbi:hypothetical protein [Jiangella alba]|uniref:Uncharacterized protein n=1 Tax=Jiangella alba TaxID=561176 RepID=A0A1H5PG30_9ACTN|nr:hypothetical protein [Jiangella alba]SEF12078.1 hypothetical protein SAMN04488561_4172 [Jiangella alba]